MLSNCCLTSENYLYNLRVFILDLLNIYLTFIYHIFNLYFTFILLLLNICLIFILH